jgi:hypothetical protein
VIADDNDDDSDDRTSTRLNDASLNRVVLIFTCGEDASMFLSELQESASSQ